MTGRRGAMAGASGLFLFGAIGIALWLAAAWGWEQVAPLRGLPHALFMGQDLPALLTGLGAMLLCVVTLRHRGEAGRVRWAQDRYIVWLLFLLSAFAAWAGQRLLMGGYALSRDEEVAQFGAAYMREGMIARAIPPEWIEYRRAIMPEFFLSFGADHHWASAYLPINSVMRAGFAILGDASLAGPIVLLAGLFALWRVALRLFPERGDVVAVVLVMALTSTQLLVTAMTPYAMTAHFAFNMIWLALVLHDTRVSHLAAGGVAVLTAGLHQWHFPMIFLAPFILWFALQRRWALLVFHALVLAAIVLIWAKLWPQFLLHQLGPPADVMPAAGVADKVGSLFARLEKWHPLIHITRFLAWNNLLLIPLAVVGIAKMPWRELLWGKFPLLPLALGCMGAAAVAIDQGYGWGYRYLHGYIGSFALLAGYGWSRMRAGSMRPIALSVLIAVLTSSFLMSRAHDLVMPYARAHEAIMASKADVVLVDPRGGRFVSDLVRGREGNPLESPVVMNLGAMTPKGLERLCERHSTIAIYDRADFLPLGVPAVSWDSVYIQSLRSQMARQGCGTDFTGPVR